jgi:hypothetical protein
MRRVERIEPGIGIGLKNPAIAGGMLLGMDAGSIRRVEEHRSRRRLAAEGMVVTHVGPNPPGTAVALGQHRHGGVVAMNALGGKDVGLDQLIGRSQRRRAGGDMSDMPIPSCQRIFINEPLLPQTGSICPFISASNLSCCTPKLIRCPPYPKARP